MRLLNALLMENLTETVGNIFKIKRFSVHDGPGIRTSVFLKGCPLNCIWCHSPEGICSDITIWYNKSLCISCGECVKDCPEHALSLSYPEQFINIDRKLCKLSGDCVRICPSGAIQFTGSLASVSDVMKEIVKDILYYTISGGGVTLTGGEPLYQPVFAREILEACNQRSIHTAVETSLFCDRSVIENTIDFIDLFIVDLKISDNVKHNNHTGKSNKIIRENFSHIVRSAKEVLVRIPMIPNITDNEDNINELLGFIHELNERIPVEYISYNPLAVNNYERLGIPFLLR